MALIIETDSDTAADISSEAAIGALTAASDQLVQASGRLSSLNASAAVFTVVLRHMDNSDNTLREFRFIEAKRADADTVYGFEFLPILVKNGEKLEVRVESTNASDTAVNWQIDWVDATVSGGAGGGGATAQEVWDLAGSQVDTPGSIGKALLDSVALLDELTEDDGGGNNRFTEKALEEAPEGSGGGGGGATAQEVWEYEDRTLTAIDEDDTDLDIDSAVGSAVAGALEDYDPPTKAEVDAAVAPVQAKTDNLPASPAATGDAMTLTSGERTSIAAAVWGATTRTLTAIADSTGVTTLLGRLTIDRAGYLDKINTIAGGEGRSLDDLATPEDVEMSIEGGLTSDQNEKLNALAKATLNKVVRDDDAGTITIFDDDGTTPLYVLPISETATTQSKGPAATP